MSFLITDTRELKVKVTVIPNTWWRYTPEFKYCVYFVHSLFLPWRPEPYLFPTRKPDGLSVPGFSGSFRCSRYRLAPSEAYRETACRFHFTEADYINKLSKLYKQIITIWETNWIQLPAPDQFMKNYKAGVPGSDITG